MKITLLYFAQLKDQLRRDREVLNLGNRASPEEVLHLLFPEAHKREAMKRHLRVAINSEYAGMGDLLHDGDEVIFIPPVAGG